MLCFPVPETGKGSTSRATIAILHGAAYVSHTVVRLPNLSQNEEAMFRVIFRALAFFSLAVAVIMAVIDATRSIAASALTFTPLRESWSSVSPETLNQFQMLIQQHTLPMLWDPVLVSVLNMPGWAVFAALAVLFLALGHRRRRPTFA
ncbi:hypothetical protein AB2N04_19505 [Nitratireductor sp. GISD-1A_MAKvit]|uniref:hypothetical protein n=1 Tax=Nitratireductor sp. GISD-1A_MAKvit TaxID=3234198 RepID=UPI00346697FD